MSSSWLRIGLVFDGIQHEKTMLPVDLTRVETIQNLKDFVSETLTLETSSFDLYLQSFWLPPRAAVQGLLRDDDVITLKVSSAKRRHEESTFLSPLKAAKTVSTPAAIAEKALAPDASHPVVTSPPVAVQHSTSTPSASQNSSFKKTRRGRRGGQRVQAKRQSITQNELQSKSEEHERTAPTTTNTSQNDVKSTTSSSSSSSSSSSESDSESSSDSASEASCNKNKNGQLVPSTEENATTEAASTDVNQAALLSKQHVVERFVVVDGRYAWIPAGRPLVQHDIVKFRTLILTSACIPRLSDYMIGKVISLENNGSSVDFELLTQVEQLDGDLAALLVNDDEDDTDPSIFQCEVMDLDDVQIGTLKS